MKTNVKTNQKNKILFFLVLLPILICSVFYYILFQTYNYIENTKEQIRKDAWEVGYMQGQIDQEEIIKQEKVSKVEDDKKAILKQLAKLESVNGKYRKILDSNNRYSLGLYHWQAHSVQDAYKRYYGKKITLPEAVEIALNDELATQLTHDAIFVKNEKFHWLLSMCKLGMITKGCLNQNQINNLFANK